MRVDKSKHETAELRLVKKTAMKIHKKHGVPLHVAQKDLAQYLGFDDFAHLRRVQPEKLKAALLKKDITKP